MQRHSPNLFHLFSFYSCGGSGMFNMGLYLSDIRIFLLLSKEWEGTGQKAT